MWQCGFSLNLSMAFVILWRPGFLAIDAASTALILHYMLDVLTKSRTQAKSSNFQQFFRDFALLALTLVADGNFEIGNGLTLHSTGAVSGFDRWLSRNLHGNVSRAWMDSWAYMADDVNGRILSQNVFAERVHPQLKDLVLFAVGFLPAFKKAHSRMPSWHSISAIQGLQCLIVDFLSRAIDTVVLDAMTQQEDSQDSQPLPARRIRIRRIFTKKKIKSKYSIIKLVKLLAIQIQVCLCLGGHMKMRACRAGRQ